MNETKELMLNRNLLAEANEIGRKKLMPFVRLTWKVVEPTTPFVYGWHLDAVSDHLEAMIRGELRNLIINIPPRHMKSLLSNVFLPAWVWLEHPSFRWIFSSYAASLSTRDSVKCRRLIESHVYQQIFRPDWQMVGDQNEKIRYENTKTGVRISTSVGGAATGEGGDFLVCDDPHSALEVHSDTKRENVIDWWRNVMSSRGNDPKTVRKLIIMQRLHEKDLAGSLLADGEWTHLRLPAYFSPKLVVPTPYYQDPRKAEGELLWPDRMPADELAKLAKEMGSMAAQGQLQQDPRPADGGLFKRHWWRFYKELPASFIRRVQFWDTAQEPGITNDYSICATWGETESGFYLIDLWRGKVEMPQLEMAAKLQAAKHSPDAVVIENKSSGVALRQTLIQTTTLPILKFEPGQNSKVVRATAATPTVEAGNCFLPEAGPWVEDFIQEHEKFPLGEHDDQVDTTSMMVEYFKKVKSHKPRARRL